MFTGLEGLEIYMSIKTTGFRRLIYFQESVLNGNEPCFHTENN